jgi:surface protein
MKLTMTQDSGDTTGTNAFTIDSAPNVALPSQAESGATEAPFSSYHVVPNEYTKVAHKNSGTDMTDTIGGVKLTTTYAAYISKTQAADTYSGQVIYTMVHPSNHEAPIANPAVLDTGKVVNSKLKSLAATVVNGEKTTITPEFDPYGDYDWNEARDEYIKSISVHLKTSAPVDFTPSEMNTISSTASKKPIYIVFDNTNDVGIMHFYTEGEKIFLPSDSSFMFYLFYNLSEISGISDWDTSNATDMSYMFSSAGRSATTFTLDLSSWNTSNVTDMSGTFLYAGSSATTWFVTIPQTNGNSIDNNTRVLYGQTTSTRATPPSGKSFTIAQP